ncbi:MAG TPA: tRNA1(Val) (adenine(37)-N6)-methyltransferase [Bacillota bacterium]|nr:tRNA1(Val) (adenine(37)-N6)-methyltransferase [Bacillota bacterium]
MSELHIHDLMAYDGLKIIQKDDVFKFSLDSLLLGSFVEVKQRSKNLLELGSGLGAVLLYLSLKTKIDLVGVDIQNEMVELSNKSIELNNLSSQIKIYHHDLKSIQTLFSPSSFDLVVSNPPFFKVNELKMLNKEENLQIARHEINVNFNDIVNAAKKMLKTGGEFYFIHRASRVEEIIKDLNKYNFVIKRMRFVYTKPGKEALMMLVEAKFGGSSGNIKILEPLYIHDKSGNYTEEVLRIFHLGEDKYGKTSKLSK